MSRSAPYAQFELFSLDTLLKLSRAYLKHATRLSTAARMAGSDGDDQLASDMLDASERFRQIATHYLDTINSLRARP